MARAAISAAAGLSSALSMGGLVGASIGRGYAGATAALASRMAVEKAATAPAILGAAKEAAAGSSSPTTSWVPDPVTGYYRPANVPVEIDAVDLRELLLSHKH